MSGESTDRLDQFDSLVRDVWTERGYDVDAGEHAALVASRQGETRLLETCPEGQVTTADVEDAVSRLIESREANGVTLVVASEVSSDLREQAEEWDVSIVDEAELRDLPEPIDFEPFLDGDGSTTSDAPAETEPDAPPAEWFETSTEDPSTDAAESPAGSADDTPAESTDESAADSRSEPELVPGEASSDASVAVEGASPEHVESTLERFERRTLALEAGALLLEVVLAALLVAVVGYLLIQVAALA